MCVGWTGEEVEEDERDDIGKGHQLYVTTRLSMQLTFEACTAGYKTAARSIDEAGTFSTSATLLAANCIL